MRSGRAFVVVRFPGMGLVLAQHTRDRPGVRVDAIVESTRVEPAGVRYGILALVRGFTKPQLEGILADLGTVYNEKPELVRRDEAAREALVRYGMSIRDLRSPALRTLVRFQHVFGVPWTRIEDGDVSLCAESRSWEDGEASADAMRRDLASHHVTAEVTVQELSAAEFEAWGRVKELLALVHGP